VHEVGEEVMVCCCYPAPFSTAAALRGTAAFARDLYKNREMAHQLLTRSAELVDEFARAVADAGGVPALVDPVASGSVISRAAFEEFALPYIERGLATISSLGMPPILHICGRSATIVDLMGGSGAAVISVDQIDLAEAAQKAGSHVCLMGNVRPTETLLEGTPEAVRAEAAACIRAAGGHSGGFILASGCEVPIEAPAQNVHALIEAARITH
jgi:uroporphyrinogen decarboxylase